MKSWLSMLMLFVAILAWTGFGGLVFQVESERTDYAEALSRSEEEATRGESAARLRASVESTEAERAALESILNISILRAVEVIEQAGRAAGASDVRIGEATPVSGASEKLAAVSVVVNASGSFTTIMRAIALFETLPIPATLEQFELEKIDQTNTWKLTARLRVLLASTTP
jgi:hypothetical protein